MKKQYIFLIMIGIILYISYLIINFTIKEYKTNSYIEHRREINETIKRDIAKAYESIAYKSSKAFKNKILKEQQSFKNKGEIVIRLTTEEEYNKFTNPIIKKSEIIRNNDSEESNILNNMTIYEKWVYLIFKKETKFN